MRFRILGPVSLSPRTPSAAKPRALLATLLVRAGEVISANSLIDELWGTEPPRTATTTLQVYVSQLRKLLAEAEHPHQATEGLLLTRSPGYLLRVPDEDFDLARFETLRVAGRTSYEKGEYADASRLLHDALGVWTGPALSGVPHGVRLESTAIRLDELRMEALEQRIMADLRLGRHRELAGELMALATEHPLRESLHGHLMVVLYRTGRQSDALRIYARLRRSLVEELGVEPGRAVRRLQDRILHSDPSLDWRPPGPGGAAVAPSAGPLRGLPVETTRFIGRHEATASAERMLRGEAGGRPVRLLTVAGRALRGQDGAGGAADPAGRGRVPRRPGAAPAARCPRPGTDRRGGGGLAAAAARCRGRPGLGGSGPGGPRAAHRGPSGGGTGPHGCCWCSTTPVRRSRCGRCCRRSVTAR